MSNLYYIVLLTIVFVLGGVLLLFPGVLSRLFYTEHDSPKNWNLFSRIMGIVCLASGLLVVYILYLA